MIRFPLLANKYFIKFMARVFTILKECKFAPLAVVLLLLTHRISYSWGNGDCSGYIPSDFLILSKRQEKNGAFFFLSYHDFPLYRMLESKWVHWFLAFSLIVSLLDIRTRNKLKKCILLVTGDFVWMCIRLLYYIVWSTWYCSILEYRVMHKA